MLEICFLRIALNLSASVANSNFLIITTRNVFLKLQKRLEFVIIRD